jgi:hypothetical protein
VPEFNRLESFAKYVAIVSALAAIRSGLVRKDDAQFPLSWYVEKRLCQHRKLILAYIAANSTPESAQYFESLKAWQQCPSGDASRGLN